MMSALPKLALMAFSLQSHSSFGWTSSRQPIHSSSRQLINSLGHISRHNINLLHQLPFYFRRDRPIVHGNGGFTLSDRTSRLHASTLHSEQFSSDASSQENGENQSTQTALSMTVDELAEVLGGWGRARLAWDCYASGVDPHFLFSENSSSEDYYFDLETNNGNALRIDEQQNEQQILNSSPTNLLAPHATQLYEYQNKLELKKLILPTPRQTQPLGSSALLLLSKLHSHCNGKIENGLATLVHISPSKDGTTKLLLRLNDGWEVETVLIPFWADGGHKKKIRNHESSTPTTIGRTTVCVSSQVGCRQGCTFCATGKMGKLRSLTTDEILAQLFFAKKIVRLSKIGGDLQSEDTRLPLLPLPEITNIVFMGMGEPADNAASVRGAIRIMSKNELFQLSATRITVSTVAPTPQSFMEFVDSKCVLAWSVHAVREELRKQLVPTTKYSMEELRRGLMDTLKKRSLRTCMVEVALMEGVNDSIREANELADFVLHIVNDVPGSKLICNLIPYNDIGGAGGTIAYKKPSMERVLAFQNRLQELGVYAHVRGTRGDEESSACGQLATSRKKR